MEKSEEGYIVGGGIHREKGSTIPAKRKVRVK